jgi:HNH endonuclease
MSSAHRHTTGRDTVMKITRPTPVQHLAAGLVRMPNRCLEWTGGTNSKGYGYIRHEGKVVRTHRLAWTLANGPIPDGLHVLHHCDNPPCCETEPTEGYPEGHLFLGTHVDNMTDMSAKGRNHQQKKTHCPAGHEYTESNTYVKPPGRRECRTCKRDQQRQRRAAR